MAGMTKDDIEERVVDIMATERNTRGGLLLSLWADIRDRGLAAEEEAEELRNSLGLANARASYFANSTKELRKEVEQLQTQLAGCSVAAKGYARGINDCEKGAYGWSASFEDVKALHAAKEWLREKLAAFEKAYDKAASANAAMRKEIDRFKAELEIAAEENGRLEKTVGFQEKACDAFERIDKILGTSGAGCDWNGKADRIIEAINRLKSEAFLSGSAAADFLDRINIARMALNAKS